MVTMEKDEELALFLELRRREKEKRSSFLVSNNNNHPLTSDADAHLGIRGGVSGTATTLLVPPRKTAAERFLDSENDKSDYDWLITPPRTPVFPSAEMEAQKSLMHQLGRNPRPTALSSRLTNIQAEPGSRGPSKPSGLNSSINAGNRRTATSVRTRPASRSSTPTSRPTLPSPRLGRSSTPTSRPTLSSTKPARASTPTRNPTTQRPSTPTRTTTVQRPSTPTRTNTAQRPSTPTRTNTAQRPSTPTRRSSTPTSRPSLPSSRSSSRPSTPTRRSSAPLSSSQILSSAPASRSSSVTRSAPLAAAYKTPVQSRGSSPTPAASRPRVPWNPDEMPGFSHEAPPNLRTSMPERPASATRGRPGARSSSSSSSASNGRPRQQSSSPARRRSTSTASSAPVGRMPISIKSISQIMDRDELRKLAPAPPKLDQHSLSLTSSLDSTGSARSLSKKSLDMALRHMDIRRSINSNLRPLMTNVPASSMYSVRSSTGGSTRSWTVGSGESPHATSSNCSSSEPSVNNAFFADENELSSSERGNSSPTSQASRW
ncbi:hypothetical protein LINGRAHAP2_LOCUS13294 [Linum grandiflorum]